MRYKFSVVLLLSLVFISVKSFAQGSFKNEFGFKTDNDAYLFYGQDRYYTNGLMLYFRHATDQNKLGEKLEKFTYEITAGQKMFNPQGGNVPNVAFHDRPFAGYLYAGASANFFYKKESILKTSIELGTVGPRSLGEDAQKLLHRVVGFYPIEGWEYQIKNEYTANLSLQYTRLLHRSEQDRIDFSVEGYLNAGTTFNGAGLGILMRTGNINQLFQTAYTNSTIGTRLKSAKLVTSETFFYAKPQINYVAYDATIQGSLFKNNSPVTFETKPIVFAQQIGFNYSSQRFTFDFGLLFKTKEVKSVAKAHQYGTIAMFYRFN
ncbi:MAG: lipid A deacylase LpxR family protein [Chitinophagaceae bacterium]|nr:MAG: lipid A deacylase LpxR family protein [Chitinophagaceae bacterium]